MTEGLPWRGPGPGRPDLPLPPDKVPLRRQGSWRKRWRYLGAFSEELLLCAARVAVGPAGQTFWAVCDREAAEMRERTRMLGPIARGEVWTEAADGDDAGRIDWAPGRARTLVRIEAAAKDGEDPLRAFLRVGEGDWVESVSATGPEGGGYTWTRKRVVPVECDVRIGERRIRCEARGIEDESCGYHPGHTVWDWSAGVGHSTDGRDLAWNRVSGINEPPQGSERTIWVDGVPSEPAPVGFDGLEAIALKDGRLEFTAECERRKEEKRAFVRYSYRQPFGTFAGRLPGGLVLERGLGVMEHHDAHW
jgi:Protein of unknown function (DUF2804)